METSKIRMKRHYEMFFWIGVIFQIALGIMFFCKGGMIEIFDAFTVMVIATGSFVAPLRYELASRRITEERRSENEQFEISFYSQLWLLSVSFVWGIVKILQYSGIVGDKLL